jgi:hypothetical protein
MVDPGAGAVNWKLVNFKDIVYSHPQPLCLDFYLSEDAPFYS